MCVYVCGGVCIFRHIFLFQPYCSTIYIFSLYNYRLLHFHIALCLIEEVYLGALSLRDTRKRDRFAFETASV